MNFFHGAQRKINVQHIRIGFLEKQKKNTFNSFHQRNRFKQQIHSINNLKSFSNANDENNQKAGASSSKQMLR